MKLPFALITLLSFSIISCIQIDEPEWTATKSHFTYKKITWHREPNPYNILNPYPNSSNPYPSNRSFTEEKESEQLGADNYKTIIDYENRRIIIDSLGKNYITKFICTLSERGLNETGKNWATFNADTIRFEFIPDIPLLLGDRAATHHFFTNIDMSQILVSYKEKTLGWLLIDKSDRNYQRIYHDTLTNKQLKWYDNNHLLILSGDISVSLHSSYLKELDRYRFSDLYEGDFVLKIETE